VCRSRGATPSAPPGMSLLRDQFRCPRTSAMETSHRAPAGSDAAVLRADAGPLPPHGLHCVWNGHAPVDRSSHTGPSWRMRPTDVRPDQSNLHRGNIHAVSVVGMKLRHPAPDTAP
jgi:hypothetical protein